jgi:tRNA(Arg) A34 adenosine deaminase TadA
MGHPDALAGSRCVAIQQQDNESLVEALKQDSIEDAEDFLQAIRDQAENVAAPGLGFCHPAARLGGAHDDRLDLGLALGERGKRLAAEDAGRGHHAALARLDPVEGNLSAVFAEFIDTTRPGEDQGQHRATRAVVANEMAGWKPRQGGIAEQLCAKAGAGFDQEGKAVQDTLLLMTIADHEDHLMDLPELTIRLPTWLREQLAGHAPILTEPREQMRFAIALARDNVSHGTGGPFGAAVFDTDGRLVAPGVNLVVRLGCSILHAEMVALALAQQALSRHDLSDGGIRRHRLVVSAEPCAMCMGAIPWSGMTELLYAARDADVRAIGFDEGNKPSNWRDAFKARGIDVTSDLLRTEALDVLQAYVDAGGSIY